MTNTGPDTAPTGAVTTMMVPPIVGVGEGDAFTYLSNVTVTGLDPNPSPLIVNWEPLIVNEIILGDLTVTESSIVSEV